MTAATQVMEAVSNKQATRRQAAHKRFPPRPVATDWPATRQSREHVLVQLTSPPYVLKKPNSQQFRRGGVDLLLELLAGHEGGTWQERWQAMEAGAAGASWRQLSTSWLSSRGRLAGWQRTALTGAVVVAVCADIVRPSLSWLVAGALARNSALVSNLARSRDPEGFGQLGALCRDDPDVSKAAGSLTLYRSSLILAAKGGTLAEIAVGDVLELLDAEAADHRGTTSTAVFFRMLHKMGIFGEHVPGTLLQLAGTGQQSPEQLIDRYHLVCGPVRDLLVDYLRERQPALDYTSLKSLAYYLGKLFWQDLERHHAGIVSLDLPAEVADAWKRRLRTMRKTVASPSATGERAEVVVPRVNYRECLTPVRAFYLDLAHWAVEDPGRWGPFVTRCPVGEEEINRRKDVRQRKARMDARTRERLPVLPTLVRAVDDRRQAAQALLEAACRVKPGEAFTAAGQSLVRSVVPHGSAAGKVWADDPTAGKRRDLALEEDLAFWAWAAVEVLRATGVRVEELLELSHHSLVQYRLPTTGELVPLLQIVPSKTDAERLLVVSPELAEVLSAIIGRIRQRSGAVPLVARYDRHECVWSVPAPLLFQRWNGAEHRAVTEDGIRRSLIAALGHTGLVDSVDGSPLRYTPHDFRRMFITDAIMNGLPPHIAQVIAGHRDIKVTMGYKAVYPEEAIQAHIAFLARRRALRPSDEYRVPTDEEWQEFLGHFERRKVSIGTCARAFSTPCIHEHACVRCSMLWPDPAQKPRLAEIRDNLVARIAEAEREGWPGEAEGLQISLAGAEQKLAQVERRSRITVMAH